MVSELCIYGDIGESWWSGDGVTESMVLEGLRELDQTVAKHTIAINSPGGDVGVGLAILTLLRSHAQQMRLSNPAFQLETRCDGYAMSSASVIFMAGDIRTVALGGVVMIHEAWSGCYGNSDEMKKCADTLDRLSQNAANIYSALCTPAAKDTPARDSAFFRGMMKEETFFIGDEAVICGLATQQDITMTASLHNALSPESLKGKYVQTMTKHYQRRTFTKAATSKSVVDVKLALKQLDLLLATI